MADEDVDLRVKNVECGAESLENLGCHALLSQSVFKETLVHWETRHVRYRNTHLEDLSHYIPDTSLHDCKGRKGLGRENALFQLTFCLPARGRATFLSRQEPSTYCSLSNVQK